MNNQKTNDIQKEYLEKIISQYGYTLSVTDMAAILKTSRVGIDHMLHTGAIPATKVGKCYRVPTPVFVTWLDANSKASQKETITKILRMSS